MVLFTSGVFYFKYLPLKKNAAAKLYFPPNIHLSAMTNKTTSKMSFRYVIANPKTNTGNNLRLKYKVKVFNNHLTCLHF